MKNISSRLLRERLHKHALREHKLLRAMLEVTYRCNFSCAHCYVPLCRRKGGSLGEMTMPQIFRLMKMLADEGCFYLGFTGGEPFMRGDFLKILERAAKIGFHPAINTNGYFIDRKTAREIAAFSPSKVDITVHSADCRAFDKIAGVDGAGRRVFDALEFLKDAGVPIGLKTCLLEDNRRSLAGVRVLAKSLGARLRVADLLGAGFEELEQSLSRALRKPPVAKPPAPCLSTIAST